MMYPLDRTKAGGNQPSMTTVLSMDIPMTTFTILGLLDVQMQGLLLLHALPYMDFYRSLQLQRRPHHITKERRSLGMMLLGLKAAACAKRPMIGSGIVLKCRFNAKRINLEAMTIY